MRRPRIGFLLPHYAGHSKSYMPSVVRALADAGAVVDVIHPLERAVDLSQVRVKHDLYVLRQMSRLSLSLAGALHQQGAVIVNPYSATAALRDRVIKSRVLQVAGVPTPTAYVASSPDQLAPLLDEGPLVVKPYQGGGGHHIAIVRTAPELARVDRGREPLFAQRCGRAFDIDLYGVDIIESDGKKYVVDMDSIPGYKGVPDAPRLLARYFYAAAERAAQGRPSSSARTSNSKSFH